jgi:hypothetical protein
MIGNKTPEAARFLPSSSSCSVIERRNGGPLFSTEEKRGIGFYFS